jgi:hypothetical protein
MAVLPDGKGKIAVTHFQTVAHFGTEFTLCKFDLETGRSRIDFGYLALLLQPYPVGVQLV